MKVLGKTGRIGIGIAALGLAVGMIAAVPATGQTAAAADSPASSNLSAAESNTPCPEVASSPGATWESNFRDRGVTMCLAHITDGTVYLQIVDLTKGAKVRFAADPCYECTGEHAPGPQNEYLQFHQKTAAEWWDWLKTGGPGQLPVPDSYSLFSTSNASFFTSALPVGETMISNPAHYAPTSQPWVYGWTHTYGWGYGSAHDADPNDTDPYWAYDKVEVNLEDAHDPMQKVEINEFPQYFTEEDMILNLYGGADFHKQAGDQIVGIDPFEGPPVARRTYVAVNSNPATKFYILNSSAPLTHGQAVGFLLDAGAGAVGDPGYGMAQLDGGKSTQLAANINGTGSYEELIQSNFWDVPPIQRNVPDTLAVYLGPQQTD